VGDVAPSSVLGQKVPVFFMVGHWYIIRPTVSTQPAPPHLPVPLPHLALHRAHPPPLPRRSTPRDPASRRTMPVHIPAHELRMACVAGDAAAVSRLLPAGGTQLNLSAARFQDPSFKSTPLIKAAVRGHVEIVRMILERALDTDVDYKDEDGATALLAAAQYHHVHILRLLADHGGNVNHLNKWRETALRGAVSTLHPDDLTRDPRGARQRQFDTVQALLRLGAGTLPSSPPPPGHFRPRPRLHPFLEDPLCTRRYPCWPV